MKPAVTAALNAICELSLYSDYTQLFPHHLSIPLDTNAAAKRYVGDADPKVLGGFGTNLSWKGFDFNMNFTYRLGCLLYTSPKVIFLIAKYEASTKKRSEAV